MTVQTDYTVGLQPTLQFWEATACMTWEELAAESAQLVFKRCQHQLF